MDRRVPIPRKRRDDLADQLGAPLYGPAPEPPYFGLTQGMIYACFTYDRARVAPLVPPGLTLIAENTAVLFAVPLTPFGWGMRDGSWTFPGLMVEERPSPDTAEACYVPCAVTGPGQRDLIGRHYMPALSGSTRTWARDGRAYCEVDMQGRLAARVVLRLTGQPGPDMASQDRYLARNAEGQLVDFVVSASGSCEGAEIEELVFTEAAPPEWQALAPVEHRFGLWIPQMIFNNSIPEPFDPSETEPARQSRDALLAAFDRQGRGAAVIDAQGRLIQANPRARQFAARHPGMTGGGLRLGQSDAARLARAVSGPARGDSLVLQNTPGRPLILQVLPLDPTLAGPGRALLLIDAPDSPPPSPRTDLFRALGLTPAEARIAAAVGGGLPPREAAERLGLKESTVRSTLKVIFAKLGVARQADLVLLSARLSTP